MTLIKFLKYHLSRISFFKFIYHLILVLLNKGEYVFVERNFFSGWGMVTGTHVPWDKRQLNIYGKKFLSSHNNLIHLIKNKMFILTQYKYVNQINIINQFRWRLFIISWSAHYALENTRSSIFNFVECGVCDGLSVYYASTAVLKNNKVMFYLYDSWDGMKEDLLLESEKKMIGNYNYLNLNNTKKNLKNIDENIFIFNKGYIPEVFNNSKNPEYLSWLHIDLNSSIPTIKTLNYFWENLLPGGVIILDDYAWPGQFDTKKIVDEWIIDKKGSLLHLPTGQAIFIKSK